MPFPRRNTLATRLTALAALVLAVALATVGAPARARADSAPAFTSVADATVRSDQPDTPIGGVAYVRTVLTSTQERWALVKFTVSGLDPADRVTSAPLRLTALDGNTGAVTINAVDPSWAENTVTWNTRPALGAQVAAGTLAPNGVTDFDVTSAVAGNGDVAFAVRTSGAVVLTIGSKENTNPGVAPQLAVQATTPVAWGFSLPNLQPGETPAQGVAAEEATTGGNTVRAYTPLGSPAAFPTNLGLHGENLVYSFKYKPADVLAGNADTAFVNFLSGAASYLTAYPAARVWWSYWHEPEDDIAAGTFTAADYRAAWGHLLTVAAQHPAVHLSNSLILMGWTLNPKSGRTFTDYYNPGVDSVTYDPYEASASYTAAGIIDPIVAKAAAIGKPWGIAETGVTNTETTATRQANLKALSGYITGQSSRPLYVCYFDRAEWTVNNDSTMTAAWQAGQTG